MTCDEIQKQLLENPGTDDGAVAAHLAACGECRETAALAQSLRAVGDRLRHGEGLSSAAQHRILRSGGEYVREGARQGLRRRHGTMRMAGLAAAAAVAVLLGVINWPDHTRAPASTAAAARRPPATPMPMDDLDAQIRALRTTVRARIANVDHTLGRDRENPLDARIARLRRRIRAHTHSLSEDLKL